MRALRRSGIKNIRSKCDTRNIEKSETFRISNIQQIADFADNVFRICQDASPNPFILTVPNRCIKFPTVQIRVALQINISTESQVYLNLFPSNSCAIDIQQTIQRRSDEVLSWIYSKKSEIQNVQRRIYYCPLDDKQVR